MRAIEDRMAGLRDQHAKARLGRAGREVPRRAHRVWGRHKPPALGNQRVDAQPVFREDRVARLSHYRDDFMQGGHDATVGG